MESELESAVELASAVAAGEVSAVEIVQRSLDRVSLWQEPTNAFTQLLFGFGLERAREIDAAVARGEDPGPLAGVPVAVKDLFDVAGQETTGCSLAYEGNLATADAVLVRRLRAAGAVIVGKTNQHELGAGATNLVSACGATANPWDVTRITGGSSGGSGAAVAAGVVPLALGTDTGGSIRIPASFCGVFGLKPTHGALPLDGVMPLAPSLDCPGPMATTAADLLRAWEVLSGAAPDGRDAAERTPARAGLLGGYFADRVHPQVLGAVDLAAEVLSALGVAVSPVEGEGIDDAPEVWVDYAWSQFAAAHGHLLERRDLLQAPTASFLQYGLELPGDARVAARRRAGEIAEWFAARLRDVDVLLAPVTPFPAPPADAEGVQARDTHQIDWRRGAVSLLTRPVNLAGLPAVALPAGFSDDGLPLSVQIIGRRRAEPTLLAVVAMLEEADERFSARRAPYPPSGLEDGS